MNNKPNQTAKNLFNCHAQQKFSNQTIIIFSIDWTILTAKYETTSAKKIWDDYDRLYKEKGFVLRFTFFIHLINLKVFGFRLITAYNADFQITLHQFCSLKNILFVNPKLAAYLHGIKKSYLDFAAAYKWAYRTKIFLVSNMMAKLED